MATAGGGGPGPGPGAGCGARKGGAGRDAEAEVWSRKVREVVSSAPANRLCFECGQRGVTYVDITLGSLVCTACSGALRGLNPPHRVKSISMTTFTEAEVLFLQARGNEACRKVWLGTFDPRTSLLPDSRDPQKVKEFLQEKYEKRKWYVAPEQSKPPQPSSSSSSSSSEPAPTQPLLGDTLVQPRAAPQRPSQPARRGSTDLLAAIGGDPFAAPQPAPSFAAFPAFPGPAPPPAAFPSFDAFGPSPAPTLGGAAPPFHPPPAPTGAAVRGVANSAPPPEGGASASSLFGPPPALPPAPYGGYSNPFVPPSAPRASTNPFQPNGSAAGAAFGGFSIAKASTNPFVTLPAPGPPFGIKHPTTNPFL